MTITSQGLPAKASRSLLRWFDRHRRDLPWRRDRDPYRIWVSEIMLQQTQVASVIPYFERFIETFPTISQLAKAQEHEVLRVWEGLGYYRRARDLHRAAQQVLRDHDGQVPTRAEDLGVLPGIGRYTLGAILSQAFGQHLPILEANSQRVLSRLMALREDPRRGKTKETLWGIAESCLPLRRPGDFNQALMELGALVCTPTEPDCPHCPLAQACNAFRLNLQGEIPPPRARKETKEVQEVCIALRRGTKVLIVRRPFTGRWAGLWEFPHGERKPDEDIHEAASRIVTMLTGYRVAFDVHEFIKFRHSVTHHRITLICLVGKWRGGTFGSDFYTEARWTALGDLGELPLSAPQRRLAKMLTGRDTQFPSK